MSTPAEGSWRSGTLIDDRYLLTTPVGSGGTATVWHARDERLGRMVAVKLLSPGMLADDLAVQRLGVEAQALARLRHRHIAEVYDYGVNRQAGQTTAAYLVMELIDGVPVRQALAEQGHLPWPQAVRIAAQTADGLAAAHARGIVHRDVAPGNILLTADGVKIIDFGICASTGSEELDADGNLIGTPAYLAPERVDNRPVQPPADVYAIGVLLYRMLSGHLPWPADTPVGLLTAPHLRPPEPMPDIAGLPTSVTDTIGACLDLDPAARPTATHLADALGTAADGTDAAAPSAMPYAESGAAGTVTHILPWRQPPAPPRSRRPAPAVLAAAVALGGLAVGGALWAFGTSDPQPPPAAAGPPGGTQPGCAAVFHLEADTGTRFAATITVTNSAPDARTPARISFDLPGDQRILSDAHWQQNARTVTAGGTRTLDPGAQLSLPVRGTYRNANPLPTTFRLDGLPCAATLLGPSGAIITPQPGTPTVAGTATGPAGPTPGPRQSPDVTPEPVPPSPDSSPSSVPSPPALSPSPAQGEA
ncbi:serine/threonine-protein kinase [Catellatospora sichuanensis]|uniref:serine/threonine-protein kinase n=1 Tax=Catellatospora sichuanensis TaxID=1969805 RepID=UPI0011828D1B|nr:serine/threonine-protein kinase [Catellatospora sichuanensis]